MTYNLSLRGLSLVPSPAPRMNAVLIFCAVIYFYFEYFLKV